jgi:hypothetical protein
MHKAAVKAALSVFCSAPVSTRVVCVSVCVCVRVCVFHFISAGVQTDVTERQVTSARAEAAAVLFIYLINLLIIY